MKKLFLILLSIGLVFGASAQKGRGSAHVVRPRVVIVGGYHPFSPYMGYGFGYSPFYPYPYASGMYHSNRPTKLSLQVEDIKNDYSDRIWSARHDKDLPRKERRQNVHELKTERDRAIIDAKRNYYKTDVK